MSEGRIYQINVSDGGVPKRRVEAADVTKEGLVGDVQAKPGIHGGPHQAVSLFARERIDALAAEGHPIAPGSTGENVTVEGIAWETIEPGARLHLGDEVVLEVTSYATPCRTIAGSFSDGRFGRLDPLRHPGMSRLYTEVSSVGTIRTGDAIRVEPAAVAASEREEAAVVSGSERPTKGGGTMQLSYVNVHVTDLERSVEFFEKTLGLSLQFSEPQFGYASFDAGPVRLGIAAIDPEDPAGAALVGRHTGIGFAVADLKARHAELESRSVVFPMKPSKQPWGGFMALFHDPDGNVYYLDEIAAE